MHRQISPSTYKLIAVLTVAYLGLVTYMAVNQWPLHGILVNNNNVPGASLQQMVDGANGGLASRSTLIKVNPNLQTEKAMAHATPPEAAKPTPTPVTPIVVPANTTARILMYHYVRDGVDAKKDPIGFRLSVSPAQLDQEVGYLQSKGYQTVTMSQVAAGGTSIKSVALTFDDGYDDFYTQAYPILKKYGWKATVYVISGKVGQNHYLNWDQIKELQAYGIEIGSHTVHHADLGKLPVDAQRAELRDSKTALEAVLGVPVVSFCYPSGKHSADTPRLAREAGYTSATTTAPGIALSTTDRFLLPRWRVEPSLNGPGFERLFP